MLIALIGAIILAMITGFVWYAPNVPTGKKWMQLTGLGVKKPSPAEMQKIFGTMIVFVVIQAIILSQLLAMAHPATLMAALQFGFMLWLGLVLPSFGSTYTFTKKPMALLAIDTGYYLVSILLMTGFIYLLALAA